MDAMQSLQAKTEQFVGALTAQERASLISLRSEDAADTLPPSLRAKVQQAASMLTPDERSQVRLLVERARARTPTDAGADATGHMIAEERVRPMPPGTGGGGRLPNIIGNKVWNASGIPQAWQAINHFL